MSVIHQGSCFTVHDVDPGGLSVPIEFGNDIIAHAQFEPSEHWECEHSVFVGIPVDLEPYGLPEHRDGQVAFESGEVSFDTQLGIYLAVRDEEPSFGMRYIRHGGGFAIRDKFQLLNCPPYDSDVVFYRLSGE